MVVSKETENYTYDLTAMNRSYLASLVADITGRQYGEIVGYIAELENDTELRQHIRNTTLVSDQRAFADLDARYGRRLGWYAFARAVKPKIVVETGVDKGLGSCVLTSALMRNTEEGHAGYYYGTDINPRAGYLLSGRYATYGKVLYGDSIASLEKLDQTIDLFINDSDHSSAYEEQEYETIADKLSPQAILLGDNSHCTDILLNFALVTKRQFIYFHETPRNHWYPGGSIGIVFTREYRFA